MDVRHLSVLVFLLPPGVNLGAGTSLHLRKMSDIFNLVSFLRYSLGPWIVSILGMATSLYLRCMSDLLLSWCSFFHLVSFLLYSQVPRIVPILEVAIFLF